MNHLAIISNETSRSIADMRENQTFHFPHQLTKNIFSYIENGYVDKIVELVDVLPEASVHIGRMSDDALRQAKYAAITSVSTAIQYGIRGGIPEETAYSLSDIFIQEIDKMSNIPQIYNRIYEIFILLADKVQTLSAKTSNINILNCQRYIDIHLYHRITVDDLAAECNLSRSWLSALFKKELGMTIVEYITEERLKESKLMLSSGKYRSISEIAYKLNFCSHSYFSECFFKRYGVTPHTFFIRHHD